MRKRRIVECSLAFILLTSVLTFAQRSSAQESQPNAIGQTPPRLSFTKGEVSFWRPGAQDRSQAQVNTPLAPGDQLYTGPRGNFEIQIGTRAFVRGGANTQLGLENLEPDFIPFKLTAGNASFDLRTVEPGQTVEVDTPNAAFTIEHAGYYRVDVSGERTSFITRRRGQATVTSAGGQSVAIAPGENVVIQGNENPQVASYSAPQLDDWDKWNYARTEHLPDAVSARYVSPGVYGVDDLDRYGTWRRVPDYGAIWVPRAAPAGWAPYSTGSWVSDPYYGWTRVEERNLHPTHTAPEVAAGRASLVPRESRGVRPPQRVLERSVVATRTPHPARQVSSVGAEQKTAPVRVPTPAPRIVSAPQKGDTATALERPPVGRSKVERRTNDRARVPAPPRIQAHRPTEQAPGGAPSATGQSPARRSEPRVASPAPTTPQSPARHSPLPRQSEPQVAALPPAAPQPSARQPEPELARPAAPANVSQRRPEQSPAGTPSVTRQVPPPRENAPQAAAPPPARPQTSGRPPEAGRPAARALPGEPANRLSPDRGGRGQHQQGRQPQGERKNGTKG